MLWANVLKHVECIRSVEPLGQSIRHVSCVSHHVVLCKHDVGWLLAAAGVVNECSVKVSRQHVADGLGHDAGCEPIAAANLEHPIAANQHASHELVPGERKPQPLGVHLVSVRTHQP
jgi:hypothetical protein